ncbi:MAG: isoleucine--tRNA ligase [Cytophagales bacterium]|nr:isoleucine--tRNA ligase [Cytophagales bacterium]
MDTTKKYPEYKQVSYPDLAREVLQFWKEEKIFKKSMSLREGAESFTFYEGPPSANGSPGIHHVMARAVKDIFCRFKTLSGYRVNRKGGWDTHGLPVELQVEKELGITKEDIGKAISIEDYNTKCKEAVMRFKGEWDDLTEQIGYWVDLDDPYITFDRNYMESLWWLLKQLHEKGLLYKGYTVQPYSPAAGTGLSSHELNQPGTYRDVKDTSVVAQFEVKRNSTSSFLFDQEDEDVRILAWTTTPWTLPANCALAIGAKITYAKVKTFNPYTFKSVSVILAKDLVGRFFSEKNGKIRLEDYREGDKQIPFDEVQEFSGKELVDVRYHQLMPYVTNEELEEKAFRVIPGDFVSTEDGTGVVHTASVFGADDFRVTQQAGVPSVMVKDENDKDIPIVDKQGRFVSEVTDFAGRFVKEEYYDQATRETTDFKPTDVLIAIKLKEDNKAFKVEKYEHSYPHCWRTDKPVLYYPLDSWFIKTTAVKDRLIELNKTINWKPESTGTGRFGNWLENLVDWNLSRSRYWGTPLPIWVTEDRQELKCIGSFAELQTEVQKAKEVGFMQELLPDDFDLHRPYVDDVFLVSDTGQRMTRELDLIDVWFDSGAMPYAQWHHPFENNETFENNYPADLIAEGVDQTRGWFFTLHAIATLLFDQEAFKNVIANGFVLDKNGNKMSKRLGNAVNPFETIDKYGPDAVRWYMISNANPWDNLKFNIEGVAEVQRKFFGTLTNTYSFFALYANLDKFSMDEMNVIPVAERSRFDRWILSELQVLIREVTDNFNSYEPTRAARAIQEFVNDQLSNWYIRLSRKRFWKSEMNADKQAAYETLYECLMVTTQLMSPIAPFYADWLYRNLSDGIRESAIKNNTPLRYESVHHTELIKPAENLIDKELSKSMHMAQNISSLIHSLRRKEKIKVRQPLHKILIPILKKQDRPSIEAVEELILSEINVKEIEYVDDASGILVKKIKPNFRKLGQEHGSNMKALALLINGFGTDEIRIIETEKKLDVLLEGETISLTLEDVEIITEDIPGWLVASEGGLTVALDISLTDVLKKEGLSRDVVNRVQNMRKDQGMEVQDKIAITYSTENEMLKLAIVEFANYIKIETQALQIGEGFGDTELDIDGVSLKVKIEVV